MKDLAHQFCTFLPFTLLLTCILLPNVACAFVNIGLSCRLYAVACCSDLEPGSQSKTTNNYGIFSSRSASPGRPPVTGQQIGLDRDHRRQMLNGPQVDMVGSSPDSRIRTVWRLVVACNWERYFICNKSIRVYLNFTY